MSALTVCASCEATQNDEKSLSKCSRCRNIAYCGRDCQTGDWQNHKSTCTPENFTLKIRLCPAEITDPSIWRTLSRPANASFANLHIAIQAAFGWRNMHCYDFVVKDPKAEHSLPSDIAEVMRSLERITRDPNTDYGKRLNHMRVVPWTPGERQGPIGWRFADSASNNRRVHSRTPEKAASKTKLDKVFGDARWKGCPLQYLYDSGDHWDHTIDVTGREAPTKQFACKGGGGHGAAEDVGSDQGWTELIKAYRTASPCKDQRSQMQWVERSCPNGDHRGLKSREKEWDIDQVNSRLSKLRM